MARWLIGALILATLLNGAGYWLKRVGFLEQEAYQSELSRFCATEDRGWMMPADCRFWRFAAEGDKVVTGYDPGRLLDLAPGERWLKLAKLVWLGAVLAVCGWLMMSGARPPSLWPIVLPAALSVIGLLTGLWIATVAHGALTAMLGLLSFGYLALALGVALSGGWLSGPERLHEWATALGVLLVVQLILVGVEALRGLPADFGTYKTAAAALAAESARPRRLVGSLVMPNTLGVFAVSVLAFYYAFSRDRRWLIGLAGCAVLLVLAARSGSGVIGLWTLLAWVLLTRVAVFRRPGARISIAIGSGLLVLLLPWVLGRPDLYDSVFGRLATLLAYTETAPSVDLWLGTGLNPMAGLALGTGVATDSVLTLLLVQTGLLGLAGFFGLIGWAMWRDAAARPFYLVLLLMGLTLNTIQAFPVNMLLGLALARSLLIEDRPRGPVTACG